MGLTYSENFYPKYLFVCFIWHRETWAIQDEGEVNLVEKYY